MRWQIHVKKVKYCASHDKPYYVSYMTMSLAALECSFSSSLSLICRLV